METHQEITLGCTSKPPTTQVHCFISVSGVCARNTIPMILLVTPLQLSRQSLQPLRAPPLFLTNKTHKSQQTNSLFTNNGTDYPPSHVNARLKVLAEFKHSCAHLLTATTQSVRGPEHACIKRRNTSRAQHVPCGGAM